ncbi:NmrA family NAD(P)-binding protein [bacterium]|nr:NmrA family NAD(P)-binding protein [bacterium]
MKPFVIAGVTGNTGKAAAQELLRLNQPVRVLVRQASKAEHWRQAGAQVLEADLSSLADLQRGLADAAGAYLLNPPNHAHPDPLAAARQQGQLFAEAIRVTSLPRAVVLSSVGGHLPSGTGIVESTYHVEQSLQGLPLTFLRPSYFIENWTPLLRLARTQGILPSMLQPLDRAVPMIATEDIGVEAARILLEESPPPVVELEGPSASPAEVASWVSEILGRPVAALENPRSQWQEQLLQAGASPRGAELLAGLQDAINSGYLTYQHPQQVRRSVTSVRTVLERLLT